MARTWTLFWNRLINVQTTPPGSGHHWFYRVYAIINVLIGSMAIVMLPLPFFPSTSTYKLVFVIRGLLVMICGGWVGWYMTWRPSTRREQRQGQMIAQICVFLLLFLSSMLLQDVFSSTIPVFDLYLYWLPLLLLVSLPLVMVRQGYVLLAGILLVFPTLFVTITLSNDLLDSY